MGSTAALGLAELPDGTLAEQVLYALPGKVPLIKKTFRPPNFETPVEYFRTAITPNDAFFVRWHLAGIPEVDAPRWTLAVGGDSVERPRSFTLAELRKELRAGRRSPRSANARATAAGCSSRTSPASNGAWAPWATRSGAAFA